MASPTPAAEEAEYGPEPGAARHGIGLCLSGGGYRATLFHAGVLRRLNELGILARPDFRTVSAVSGGSIAAAVLADALAARGEAIPEAHWDREVRDRLRAFTGRNVRTSAVLRRALPWNWLRASAAVEAIARTYEAQLTALKLEALPEKPDFIFCATDMTWGVNWIFTRTRMGDYRAGYRRPPPEFPLARAVAASSCFPPVFNPLPVGEVALTDGGAYDNMGLEPVWKSHAVVLVSDAGGLFTAQADRGLLWRLGRYQGIQEQQARGLRKRWLLASFLSGTLQGAYWGIGGARSSYGGEGGYAKAVAHDAIAQIRTDLDAFSASEAAILENHGYLLADAAIAQHAPGLRGEPLAPLRVPHPDLCPPAVDEAKVRGLLAASGKRRLFGRR